MAKSLVAPSPMRSSYLTRPPIEFSKCEDSCESLRRRNALDWWMIRVGQRGRVDARGQGAASARVRMAVCTENLNPNVMVMKSAKDRIWRDRSDPLNRAKGGRIFIQ
jgi:hypothetical protein